MLEVSNLEVVYNDVILVLRGLSIEVPDGEIVALLGPNGAGKTTTSRAATGLLGSHGGAVTKGTVTWRGQDITTAKPSTIVGAGIAQVMEGRRIFAEMSIDDNLTCGAYSSRANEKENRERMLDLFPVLRERRDSTAGYLSGGEQQMLAIARALMAEPELLILDEPSLGLAPKLVEQVRDVIVDINSRGTSVLLIEQNAAMALSIASHGYIMDTGKVVMDDSGASLRDDPDVQEFYLGMHTDEEGERKSFRDVKHYRRRKRWSA